MSYGLEKGSQYLMENKRFFGELLHKFQRKEVPIGTMGVAYQDNSIVLYYDKYFVENISAKECAAAIEHECMHIINEHHRREMLLEPEFDRTKAGKKTTQTEALKEMQLADILNICEDLAINQWIDNIDFTFTLRDKEGVPILDTREMIVDEKSLKKYLNKGFIVDSNEELDKFMIKNPNFNKPQVTGIVTIKYFRKFFPDNTKIEEKQPFEYYYNLLKKSGRFKMMQVVGNGFEVIPNKGNHDMGEISEGKDCQNPEIRKEIAKQAVNEAIKAMEDARKAGDIPGDVKVLIDAMNKKPRNWTKDVSKFVAKCSSVFKEITRNKRNRRQRQNEPLISGFRNKCELALILVIDTSGSMENVVLEQIAAEGRKLDSMGISLLLIECDSKVTSVRKYKGERNLAIHGRGGTAFNPVFSLVNSNEFASKWGQFDGMIFFTDGGCNERPADVIKPKIPILWAMTDGHERPVDWGWETEVIVKK